MEILEFEESVDMNFKDFEKCNISLPKKYIKLIKKLYFSWRYGGCVCFVLKNFFQGFQTYFCHGAIAMDNGGNQHPPYLHEK